MYRLARPFRSSRWTRSLAFALVAALASGASSIPAGAQCPPAGLTGGKPPAAPTGCKAHFDVPFTTVMTAQGPKTLVMDIYFPENQTAAAPGVLWLHQGGWQNGDKTFYTPHQGPVLDLCQRGYVVASADYRLTHEAIWPAQIQDVRSALRFLRANAQGSPYDYWLDKTRLGVWGLSAGGHLALMAALSGGVSTVEIGSATDTVDLDGPSPSYPTESSRAQAVVAYGAIYDPLQIDFFQTDQRWDYQCSRSSKLLGGTTGLTQQFPERAMTATPGFYATKDDPPAYLAHGTYDQIAPFHQAVLGEASLSAAGVPVTFERVQQDTHSVPNVNTNAVYAFLDANLKNAPAVVVTIAATDPNASEPGANTGSVTITRTGRTAYSLPVNVATSGRAAHGIDYSASPSLSVPVTIPANSSSVVVTLTALNDALVEGSENAVVTLAPGAGYRLDPAVQSATVAIADDESSAGLPTVQIMAIDQVASETGGNSGRFRITRPYPAVGDLEVELELSGTATAIADFATLPNKVTIPNGSTAAEFDVVPVNDAALEFSETVFATLQAGPNYALGSTTIASVRIEDDDKEAALTTKSIVNAIATLPTVAESSATPAKYTLYRAGVINAPFAISIAYAMSGPAQNGVDYQLLSGQTSFDTGEWHVEIPVQPISDVLFEGNETAILTVTCFDPACSSYLAGPVNGAAVTITD